uniref:Uncharacterized protein n=1 Tax=Anguilla anguilla TaxID=7936 RepID=A0A0E9T8I2_ANGAN
MNGLEQVQCPISLSMFKSVSANEYGFQYFAINILYIYSLSHFNINPILLPFYIFLCSSVLLWIISEC